MASKGWHPDPGGEKGFYRYWDGSRWSTELSPTPIAAPPRATFGAPLITEDSPETPQQRGTGRLVLIVIAAIVALALIVMLAIRASGVDPFTGRPLAGDASQDVCPKEQRTQPSQRSHPSDGRVHGGMLSFPQQPIPPWEGVTRDSRVPFGRDVRTQNRIVVQNFEKGGQWVSALLVAELYAGDGFYTPEEGSAIVVKCVQGRFYGDMKLTREDRVSKPYTLGSYNGWYTEVHFGFDHPRLPFKGETAIIIILATGPDSASLFYASIPDGREDDMASARAAIADLRVG